MEPPVLAFQDAIKHLHGCGSRYVETIYVIEVFEGQTAWEGPVAVFDLDDHPEAERCYAWSHAIEGSEDRRFVAVLEGGGIDSPQTAVRAAIVDEAKTEQIRHEKAKRALALRLLRKQAAEARQLGDSARAVEIEKEIAWIERGEKPE